MQPSLPANARAEILAGYHYTGELPGYGASFFIHLSELCPVGCLHCMYSSTMQPKSRQTELSDAELAEIAGFINETRSVKLNITGGGEPFLRFNGILQLLRLVSVPRVEIVTAGYWAKSQRRAAELLAAMEQARCENPADIEVMLRLSIDRFHLTAPAPVLISHYANVVRAWTAADTRLRLGMRSIQPDRDTVDVAIADEIGAEIEDVDDWNRVLRLPCGEAVPITFNVFRTTGSALTLGRDADVLRAESMTIGQYYRPFESGDHRLSLATAVNDAIRGEYRAGSGVALTMNSDRTLWIFCGTAPDHRLRYAGQSFAEVLGHFYADPITDLLVNDGLWALAGLVEELQPAAAAAAIGKNDVASLVEDLLADPAIRAQVTLDAARRAVRAGRARFEDSSPYAALVHGVPTAGLHR